MDQMNENYKLQLAQKLMNEEIDINSLTDEEVEEMIGFFINYIADMDRKLEKIKRNILKIRKKINRK